MAGKMIRVFKTAPGRYFRYIQVGILQQVDGLFPPQLPEIFDGRALHVELEQFRQMLGRHCSYLFISSF